MMKTDSKWYKPKLARPLVWSDRHNRIIVILAFAAFPIAFILRYFFQNAELYSALWIAAGAPVAVFMTWAIGRESDPGRPLSALIAALASLVAWFFFSNPDFILLVLVLMCLRIVGRPTGLGASLPESVFTLLLAAWLCWSGYVFAGAVAGLAFWLDARLPDRKSYHYLFALLAIVACIAASLSIVEVTVLLGEVQLYFLAVSVLLIIPSIMFYQGYVVQADNGTMVPTIRTMVVIGLTWLFLAAGAVTYSNVGLESSYPVLCVLFGMGILNTVSLKRAKTQS
ncbi:MAG: hypothetical protein WBB45_08295 [Cyclobacteriaceae bacterium]